MATFFAGVLVGMLLMAGLFLLILFTGPGPEDDPW
jgi:hypothetical protein